MKFDKIDKKLISYLYHHYREPLTKIGKACRLSRDQVEYRLRKYESEGLIKKYMTVFNYDLLGYHEVAIVWIKTNQKEFIMKKLESMKNVISVGEFLSSYDLFINIIFKDKNEFESVFYSFLEKNKESIQDFLIFSTTEVHLYPLKFFGKSSTTKDYESVAPNKNLKVGKKDIEIMKILESNGREKIVEISKKTGLSSELIIHKIKKLHKNKIILGNRLLLGMEKHGFYFAVMKLKLKNLDSSFRDKIKNFCKKHPNISNLVFGIGEYNCLIQPFYQTEEDLRKTLRDINEKLKAEIISSELLLIENEGRLKTLPF